MKHLSAVLTFLVLAVLVAAPAAHAQATRTWVSGVGDDANPCSRTAPCKTFAGAISKTAAGGEISVLDPAGFGAVTITKAITISGDGTLAGILVGSGSGVIINAGVNDRIILRNLSFHGVGATVTNGIRFLAGKSLLVDSCTFSGFPTRGIDVSLAASADVFVKDTTITNSTTGFFINSTAGTASASLDRVNFTGLGTGIEVANARATISNSVISNNTSNGVLANNAGSRVNVDSSQLSFNGGAAFTTTIAGALIRISNNDIYNNGTSITITAGTVASAGNNRVAGNGGASVNPNSTVTSQ